MKRLLTLRNLAIAAVLGAALGFAVFWIVTMPATVSASALPPYTPNLDNGKTMFNIGGCASCHAVPDKDPKKVDHTRLGGGLALGSPFGTFYAPNISPDAKDGIGAWSEADFVTAMWDGTAPDGSHLFPAFPYASYRHMQLNDVRDLFAYLKTLPPVAGKVRDHDLAFPFNIRRLVGGWKFLFLKGGPLRAGPVAIGAMEPRRLSGQRSGALRRMPFAAQFSRRHHRQPALCRRPGAGRQRLGAEHHAGRPRPVGQRQGRLVGKGDRAISSTTA